MKQNNPPKNTYLILVACVFLLSIPAQVFAFDLNIGINIGGSHDSGQTKNQHKGKGPPDHAPAHGYRAKHNYRYYPSSQVYFDTGRGVYFYLSGSNWTTSINLPSSLKISLGSHVSIEMDSSKPYTKHSQHKSSYPPGQMKKVSMKHKNKGKKHK